MGVVNGRYGISAAEVVNLRSRYQKNKLKEGFGSFDTFLRFASECEYKPGQHLRRYDASQPHSPENSFFYDSAMKEKLPPKKSGPKATDIVSPYCKGCKMKCPERGTGCLGWQMYFVRNWNQNIRIHPAKPAPEPPKREYFQYEHPDTVRRMKA